MMRIKRFSKNSVDKQKELEKIEEKIVSPWDGRLFCHLRRNKEEKSVHIKHCCTKCYKPCNSFLKFEFVPMMCEDENCSLDRPCLSCLKKIELYKVYIHSIHLLCGDKKYNEKRFRKYVKRCR
tara:strand:- start:3188 stop:3556 length:369 start_codon:yes stop_codon:yes gene_type:complete